MDFVERRQGGLYVTGSRISLATIIHAFRNGDSAETIQQDYPSLTLGQVYGAIAHYLTNEAECDAYLLEEERIWRDAEQRADTLNSPLQQSLRAGRVPA